MGEELTLGQCEWMVLLVYPYGLARHILRAAQNHFQSNLPSAPNGRAGGKTIVSHTHDFCPTMMGRVMGQERLSAVLPGVAPGARKRYLGAWYRWGGFTKARHQSPWIWGTAPGWEDALIDFIIFESKISASAPNTISCKISGIRFWRLLVGMPDFTLGGCRYTQVLKCARSNSRVNHKMPDTMEMLTDITSQQCVDMPETIGISCAALVGFFYLLHVGELEGLRWTDVLFIDTDGDPCLQLTLPRSKTDQYNDGRIKVLGGGVLLTSCVRCEQWLGGWVLNQMGERKVTKSCLDVVYVVNLHTR